MIPNLIIIRDVVKIIYDNGHTDQLPLTNEYTKMAVELANAWEMEWLVAGEIAANLGWIKCDT